MAASIKKTAVWLCLALLAAASLMPLGGYFDLFVFSVLIIGIMAVSFDIPGGHLGLISLGHAAYFGIGGYVFGIAAQRGAGFFGALFTALLAGALAGVLLAFPLARLREGYYSLATLGILFILKLLADALGWLTGGSAGLYVPQVASGAFLRVLAFGLLAATCLLHHRMLHSRLGVKFKQTEASEDVARSVGINTEMVKMAGLFLAALPAALAGSLYMARTSYLSPDSGFSLALSITALLASRILPLEGLAAPLLGAVLIAVLEELIWTGLSGFQHAVFGLLLLFFALFAGRRLAGKA